MAFLIYSKRFAPNLFNFTQAGRVLGVEHHGESTQYSAAHNSGGVV